MSSAVGRLGGPTSLVLGVASVVGFLFAVRLLGVATAAAAPTLRRALTTVVVGDGAALGAGWLAAYALGNGSVVAALGLSLFEAGLLTVSELFLVVAGSRLGAAAVVVFVGALDHLQRGRRSPGDRPSLTESVRVGSLTFLLTLSVYLPVAVLGYLALPWLRPVLRAAVPTGVDAVPAVGRFGGLPDAVTVTVGPGPALVLAVAVLFGSLLSLDRMLGRVDARLLGRGATGRFRRPWLAFAVGLLLTGLTTSVAFSLGVVVPLYNRGQVTREQLVPYALGANVGTLFDTLLVALVLGSPDGVATVGLLLVVAVAVTAAALVDRDRYRRAVLGAEDRLHDDRRVLLGFAALLLALPLGLVGLPHVMGG